MSHLKHGILPAPLQNLHLSKSNKDDKLDLIFTFLTV